MRQLVEKQILSGSTHGKRIKVVATATAGTLIHTATTSSTAVSGDSLDWITLYAQNSHSADVMLTIEWGGVAAPDDLIQQTIVLKSGDALVVAGLPLRNTLIVRAFAAVANVVTITGFVERTTLE